MSQLDNLGRIQPCMQQKVGHIIQKRFDMQDMENSILNMKEQLDTESEALKSLNERLDGIDQALNGIGVQLDTLEDVYIKKTDHDAVVSDINRKCVSREEYEQIVVDFEDSINQYFNKTPRIDVNEGVLRDLRHEMETLREDIKRLKVKKDMPPINIIKKNKS